MSAASDPILDAALAADLRELVQRGLVAVDASGYSARFGLTQLGAMLREELPEEADHAES